MEIEGLAEINVLCASFKRLRKKNKPVEPVVEALNRLGSRRPTRQRFSLSYNSTDGQLTVKAKHTEWIPTSVRQISARMIIDESDSLNAVNT